jgi:hypothetical protein
VRVRVRVRGRVRARARVKPSSSMPVTSNLASSLARRRARKRRLARSVETIVSTPRRCTLMTTSRPSRIVARCTEAIEAVASGVSSMRAKRDEGSAT